MPFASKSKDSTSPASQPAQFHSARGRWLSNVAGSLNIHDWQAPAALDAPLDVLPSLQAVLWAPYSAGYLKIQPERVRNWRVNFSEVREKADRPALARQSWT